MVLSWFWRDGVIVIDGAGVEFNRHACGGSGWGEVMVGNEVKLNVWALMMLAFLDRKEFLR